MKEIIKAGTTSKRQVIFVQDASKTTGVGLTGLTNASAGLKWYYYIESGNTSTVVSVVGQTLGTWTSGGFKEIDSTNMPGFYEIGIPNAVIASTAWSVMQLEGATNMVPVNVEFEIISADLNNGTNLGLTSLPGTAAATTGGLPTIGVGSGNIDLDATGRVDVSKWLGTAVTAVTGGIPDVNVKNYNNQTAVTDAQNLPKVDTEDWKGGIIPAPNVTGVPKADVVDWLGTLVTAAVAGVPDVNAKNLGGVATPLDANNLLKVDIEDVHGTAITTNILSVSVSTNLDKTGYSLTQAFPANFASLAITAGGAITINAGQIYVKKNQPLSTFTFPMFSATTGSLLAGATVASLVSIDGGSPAATTNSPSSIGSGLYLLNLAAADLNGAVITLILTASGALDQTVTFVTQP